MTGRLEPGQSARLHGGSEYRQGIKLFRWALPLRRPYLLRDTHSEHRLHLESNFRKSGHRFSVWNFRKIKNIEQLLRFHENAEMI